MPEDGCAYGVFVPVGGRLTVLKPEDGVMDAGDDVEDSEAVTGLFGKLLVVVSTGVELEEGDWEPVP